MNQPAPAVLPTTSQPPARGLIRLRRVYAGVVFLDRVRRTAATWQEVFHLLRLTGCRAHAVTSALAELEALGAVSRGPGQRFTAASPDVAPAWLVSGPGGLREA